MDQLEKNIRAILETNFSGFKDEIVDTALKNIMAIITNESEVRKNVYDLSYESGYQSGYEDAENDLLNDILPLFGLDISQFKKDDE